MIAPLEEEATLFEIIDKYQDEIFPAMQHVIEAHEATIAELEDFKKLHALPGLCSCAHCMALLNETGRVAITFDPGSSDE